MILRNSGYLAIASAALLAACGGDDDLGTEAKPVVEQYATIVRASYADMVTQARALDKALEAFVAAPSETTLEAAKQAWIAARVPYRPTEVYRFYGGPIDDPDDEREGRINSWPMAEAHVDYVNDKGDAGIINHPDTFPTIDAEVLIKANGDGGEEFISTGFHTIEFLLWGQDLSDTGPGTRPFTDYVDGGTASNQGRRRTYLGVVSDLLVADLEHVAGRWDVEKGDYTAKFVGKPVDSLTRILTGIGTMAASELSGERMATALENKDQEDEHSCFSDTTTDDILGNARGIENVYYGRYGGNDGPGLDELVAARDRELDALMKDQLTKAIKAIESIPKPFDQAIKGDDTADGRVKIAAAVTALQDIGKTVKTIAETLNVKVKTNLEP